MRTKGVIVNLSKWFPPNDELAKKIARLCILREELIFQFQCARESRSTPIGDAYGSSWRTLYYVRHMFNTLKEIFRSIETLSRDINFKSLLKAQSPVLQKEFRKLKKNFYSVIKNIGAFRNEIGEHIDDSIVEEALLNMNDERNGLLYISQGGPLKTQYKFAGELIMSILFRNSKRNQFIKAQEVADALTIPMQNLFYIIDSIFFAYIKDRKLLKINLR